MILRGCLALALLLSAQPARAADPRFEPPPCPDGQQRRIDLVRGITRFCGTQILTTRTREGLVIVPVNGTETTYAASGAVIAEIHYKGPLRDGWAREFYPSGKPSAAEHWLDGKRQGLATHWYPDGTQQSETEYRADLVDGIERTWFASGAKQAERAFQAGKLHGAVKTWAENGQLMAEETYALGEPMGLWRTWRADGKPLRDGVMQGSAFSGTEFTYFVNGARWDRRELVAGVQWGKQETWDSSGKWLYGKCVYAGKGIWSAKSSEDLAAMPCLAPEFVADTCKSLCAHHVSCMRQIAPDQVPPGQEEICPRDCTTGITQHVAQSGKVVMLMERCKAAECGAYEACLKQWWFVMQ
jgi:antitoxin component YwqK of YwqJK toxin-antitoxin module